MPPQPAGGESNLDSNTILAASMSSAPRLLSAVVDSLPAKESQPAPFSSGGVNASPSKTCNRCMGGGVVLVNAGTGLAKPCVCNTRKYH